jgi:hypothetical protein
VVEVVAAAAAAAAAASATVVAVEVAAAAVVVVGTAFLAVVDAAEGLRGLPMPEEEVEEEDFLRREEAVEEVPGEGREIVAKEIG